MAAERDPETLLGPLLWLLTRLARNAPDECRGELLCALVEHCTALASHPGVPPALRVALGGIAIEQRGRANRC
ncbi:MAG: hypothetical protein U1F41_17045 [Burkholderiales bacterium]